MLVFPPPSPSVRIHHYPIPDRLAPYIERAVTQDFTGAVGLRWQMIPSGSVGFCFAVGDPDNGFDLPNSEFDCMLARLLPRAMGAWCFGSFIELCVDLTPLASTQLPMEALRFGRSAWTPGEDVLGRGSMARLQRQVRDAPTLDAKMQALLRWIEQLLFDHRPACSRRLAIGEVATLMRRFDAPRLIDAARRVGVSLRQFERDFQRYLGGTPRRYAQVAKVQQMAQLVWRGNSLADTAAALGFADQAHMTRLVRDVTGMPPAMLLQRAHASPFARVNGASQMLCITHV
jgi:AraC-like DNA-binding protein